MGIYRRLNKINIEKLDNQNWANKFLTEVQATLRGGFHDIELDFSNITSVFPNAAVPVAGLIEYYRIQGVQFDRLDTSPIITSTHLMDPIEPQKYDDISSRNVLNKVWRFSSSQQVFWLVDSYLKELPKLDQFKEGVLNGIEWCINEIMDNVIQHSGEMGGFVMGQLHKTSKHVAFTVFDYGQGIYNSLKTSLHAPRHPVDALTLCIKEGVTRDRKIGQGNGMYGLHQVVKYNEGRLTLTSNNASYFLMKNRSETFTKIPSISREKGCTTVDFQLDYGNNVSISEALNFNGKSYDVINQRIEELENNFGDIIYGLRNKANGYGTRQSGERVRNDILNISRESKKVVVVDFEGITVVSSSFADELIGKMVIELGFFGFNNMIRLKNMNSLVQSIIQLSVAQRMIQSLD